jgi:hypothetical protein
MKKPARNELLLIKAGKKLHLLLLLLSATICYRSCQLTFLHPPSRAGSSEAGKQD